MSGARGDTQRVFEAGQTLQTPGQLVKCLHHRGYEISSPAILGKMTNEYKATVVAFAKRE